MTAHDFDSYSVGGLTLAGDLIGRKFAALAEAQAWAIEITRPGLAVSLFGWRADECEEIAAYAYGRLL